MVSPETGLAADFDPASGRNIRWRVALGTETHSSPVVAGGKVLIGTNNGQPRDPKHAGDRGVLMCLDERTGALAWQLVVPKRSEDPYFDWPNSGISSPATVEGDRVYTVTNRGEVVCLDLAGLSNGNDGPFVDEGRHMSPADQPAMEPGPLDADILWITDLTTAAGIWSHDAAHSSILIHGPHLYLNSGTGVDNTHRVIRTPDAPSLVVIDKASGRLIGRDREGIAPTIFHCTWSSPSMSRIDGRSVLFFCGGNGIVYAFDPLDAAAPADRVHTLKKRWQYDPDPTAPKSGVHLFTSNRQEGPSVIHGMPVVEDGRLFVAGGGDLWWGKNRAWIQSIDTTTGSKVWEQPLEKHVMSTPAVAHGLCFIADTGRVLRCLDARTGAEKWSHEGQGEFWGSPLVADGRLYLGSRRGDFWIFAASAEKKQLGRVQLGAPVSSTVCAHDRTLYVATMNELIAVANGEPKTPD
jgi:outer membrane protein assembly factor BamB